MNPSINTDAICNLPPRDLLRRFIQDDQPYDEAAIALVARRAYRSANDDSITPRDLQALTSILHRSAELGIRRQRLALEREKYNDARRSDIETALTAFRDELDGNDDALAALESFEARLLAIFDRDEPADPAP